MHSAEDSELEPHRLPILLASVRHLMAAVLVVALLIPFPFWTIPAVLVVLLVYFLPTYVVLILDVMVHRRLALGVILLLGGFGWARILTGHPGSFLPNRGGPDWINWASFAVRPLHLVGPILVARHFWREEPINSGLILWAWMGMIEMGVVFAGSPPRHGDRLGSFDLLIQFARVTAVLVVCLTIYGKRPSPGQPTWTYYLGWTLAEYDAILWGCYSGWWLLYE